VLKISGGNLTWGPDKLTLPYTGVELVDGPVFDVWNIGTGQSVKGTSGIGNYGYLGGASNGVYGFAASTGGNGVLGEANTGSNAAGVKGRSSTGYGVYGEGPDRNYGYLGGPFIGARGYASTVSGIGVFGTADNGYNAYGVWGVSSSGYAGYFSGKVHVTGTLSKGGGSFKIDHPLDPEHKYLYHSFVESPDMMNIYNGNVVTDENGFAEIMLPEWFEALNRDFRYQLTVIDDSDRFVLAKVVQEIHNNRFTIRTNFGHVKVSWQVTGIRKDPWAEAHRIPVEEVKPPEEQGTYLHPKEWGQPEEKGRDYPKLQEMREEQVKHQEQLGKHQEEMAKHQEEAAKLQAAASQK
jgi:hypothetical protein